MANDETTVESSVNKEKREIIILVFIFSAVSTFFTHLFDKTGLEQIIGLAAAISIGFFILWWCKIDSLERSYELKPGFRILIVLFGAFALIFYLFKSRGFRNGLVAVSYALLIFIGLIIINTFITAIYAVLFNVEIDSFTK